MARLIEPTPPLEGEEGGADAPDAVKEWGRVIRSRLDEIDRGTTRPISRDRFAALLVKAVLGEQSPAEREQIDAAVEEGIAEFERGEGGDAKAFAERLHRS